ncbi:MAG: thioredoxin domain-containing protein [Dehalococcoidia bacterium]|nr:thioredoxin domain-containing protein [Dehalococcoidia bacterium]
MDAPLKLTVFSSYICPWCYLGLARVEKLAGEIDLAVDWQPFELHPEIPPEGMAPEDLFGGHRRADDYMGMLREEGEKEGLIIRAPRRISRSLPSLEAAEFARDSGEDAGRFRSALFEAYFSEGRDIGDQQVLLDVATGCGMDGGMLTAALSAGAYRDSVRDITRRAHQSGVTGTPTFIFDDRFAMVGAQSFDVFRSVAQRLIERRTTVPDA